MTENPYEAAYPAPEKQESKVPWLALLIMAGAILVCVAGLFAVYAQRQAARARAMQAQAEFELQRQTEQRTESSGENLLRSKKAKDLLQATTASANL